MVWVSEKGMYSPVRRQEDLVSILETLCRRDDEGSAASGDALLADFVEAHARLLNRTDFLLFMKDVYSRIETILSSGGRSQTLGALTAVRQLIDVNLLSDDTPKTRKLAEFLTRLVGQAAGVMRAGMPSVDRVVILHTCATLGWLVKSGSSVTGNIAGSEIEKALAEMENGNPHVALLVLKEMADNAPAVFNLHVRQFLTAVLPALSHQDKEIRLAAVQALRACLRVVEQRPIRHWQGLYRDLLNKLLPKLGETKSVAEIHGSLLALGEIILNSGTNLLAWFRDIAEQVLAIKQTKDALIQTAVVQVIPSLAKLCPQRFATDYLESCVDYLLQLLYQQKSTSVVLSSWSELLAALSQLEDAADAVPMYRLPEFVQAVEQIWSAQGQLEAKQDAVKCIGDLVVVLNRSWKAHALDLLHPMLQIGLSSVLLEALKKVVATYERDVMPILQGPLLELTQNAVTDQVTDGRTVEVALQALASFRFSIDPSRVEFIHGHIYQHLYNLKDERVRRAAGLLCRTTVSSVLKVQPGIFPRDSDAMGMVETLMDYCVGAAVADTSVHNRCAMFEELLHAQELFPHLSQDRPLMRLAYGMHDASFEVKELAIHLVGELSKLNHATVFPVLRRVLGTVLADIELKGTVATVGVIVRDSARVLGFLVKWVPRILELNKERILNTICDRLGDLQRNPSPWNCVKNPEMEAREYLLRCICTLVDVHSQHLGDCTAWLGPLVAREVMDSTTRSKQIVAVNALGKIVNSVGKTAEQYLDIPQLLHKLLRTLDECTESERQDVLGTMGILGQLDPSTWRQLEAEMKDGKDPQMFGGAAGAGMDDADDIQGELVPTCDLVVGTEEHYTSMAINVLMHTLTDPVGGGDQVIIVTSLMTIFEHLGRASVPYLEKVLPVLHQVLKDGDKELRLALFSHFADLVGNVGTDVQPFAEVLLALSLEFWGESKDLMKCILSLLTKLIGFVQGQLHGHMKVLVPRLGQIFSQAQMRNDFDLVELGFDVLEACGPDLQQHFPLIEPILTRFIQRPHAGAETPAGIRAAYLRLLCKLLPELNISLRVSYSYVSEILLSLINLLYHEPELRSETVDALCAALVMYGPQGAKTHIEEVDRAVQYCQIEDEGLHNLIRKTLAYSPEELEASAAGDTLSSMGDWAEEVERLKQGSTNGTSGHRSVLSPRIRVSIDAPADNEHNDKTELASAWETMERSTRQDWEEWMRSVSVEMLRHSESPSLRACHSLAQVNPNVARRLFTPSLLSCWPSLGEHLQEQVLSSLKAVFVNGNSIPAHVVSPILRLIQFVESCNNQLPVGMESLSAVVEEYGHVVKNLRYKVDQQ